MVRLDECPIGLFIAGGELCLKTEYGNNDGRIDAYIVSSGEMFWGAAPQTVESQRAQMVEPVENVTLHKRPVMPRTADTAPIDTPILVWVADVDMQTKKPIGWRMGKCWNWRGSDPQLYGDGLNGDWNIPFWHPLPDDPK